MKESVDLAKADNLIFYQGLKAVAIAIVRYCVDGIYKIYWLNC